MLSGTRANIAVKIFGHDLQAPRSLAALERLVPILMTALALVPLALSAGQPGSEIQAPMAVVILSGPLSSTLLNMIVVPALYLRFGSVGRRGIGADTVPVMTTE